MNRIICLIISLVGYCGLWASPVVVEVSPQPGNDNQNMIASIEKVSLYKGKPVVIKLHPGVYDLAVPNPRRNCIMYPIQLQNRRIPIR